MSVTKSSALVSLMGTSSDCPSLMSPVSIALAHRRTLYGAFNEWTYAFVSVDRTALHDEGDVVEGAFLLE